MAIRSTLPSIERRSGARPAALAAEDRAMAVGASPYEPTAEILRISARILLHVAGQPRIALGETAPPSLTQAGMASALGTTQSAVSNALKRLVDGGALQVDRLHVHRARQRLKVYQLTELGERLVAHIRSRLDLSTGNGRRSELSGPFG